MYISRWYLHIDIHMRLQFMKMFYYKPDCLLDVETDIFLRINIYIHVFHSVATCIEIGRCQEPLPRITLSITAIRLHSDNLPDLTETPKGPATFKRTI